MFFRVTFNAPPLGRVTKWFSTDDASACQQYIGKLQLKGYTVDCQRVTKEQYQQLREHNSDDDSE